MTGDDDVRQLLKEIRDTQMVSRYLFGI